MKIKHKAKRFRRDFTVSSRNQCTVTIRAPHGRLLPMNVAWESYPPSHTDISELNDAVAEWAGQLGIALLPEQLNVVDNTRATEDVVADVARRMNAGNN